MHARRDQDGDSTRERRFARSEYSKLDELPGAIKAGKQEVPSNQPPHPGQQQSRRAWDREQGTRPCGCSSKHGKDHILLGSAGVTGGNCGLERSRVRIPEGRRLNQVRSQIRATYLVVELAGRRYRLRNLGVLRAAKENPTFVGSLELQN